MNPLFRPAEIEDINDICHGLERAFIPLLDSYYKNGYYPYFANRKWIEEKIENEFVYICQLEEKLCGAIILCKEPDRYHLKLHTVYIEEPFRRKGLATFLILNAEAVHSDAASWQLETLADLAGNIALYEKLGYERYSMPKVVNDKVTVVYYRKTIGL